MTKQKLHIIKIGGSVVNDPEKLDALIQSFNKIAPPKILVHGGGRAASDLCEKLSIPVHMIEGRRVTDGPALEVAVMVYAGLINKTIVAKLQASKCSALGLTGADINIIPAQKRDHSTINYGFVGDINPEDLNTYFLKRLLQDQVVPVFSAITHDGNGQLLNTNADTIAATVAVALSHQYTVELTYSLGKPGVLRNIDDNQSVITSLPQSVYSNLKRQGTIQEGMIPKLDTAFMALTGGVSSVKIKQSDNLNNSIGTILSL